MSHVLLTRFNLPTGGVEGLIRAREGWLRDRLELFERFCAPSVAAQTTDAFDWLVYLDPESPEWLLERLRRWEARGLFRAIYRTRVSREELESDIRSVVTVPGEWLITTNLDNDDGLAVDFCERLAAVQSEARAAVYLTRGLVTDRQGLYLHRDRRNAFCSVRERWSEPVTAWSGYHNELGRDMTVIELDGPPGWLQVIHGDNVSNRVRGRRVSPVEYSERFGELLHLPVPRRTELLRDALVRRPLRTMRDNGRATARRAGLRVLGKERYSALKTSVMMQGRRGP